MTVINISYRYSSKFAMLDIRVFANSSWTSCIPVLEIRHFVFRKFVIFKISVEGNFQRKQKKYLFTDVTFTQKDKKYVFPSLWGHISSKIIVNYMYYIVNPSGEILKQLFRNSSFFAIRHDPWRRINDEFRGIPVIRMLIFGV